MKKLIIAAIVLVGLSAANFAQSVPAKKSDAKKMQVVRKATDAKTDLKVVPMSKAIKPTVATTTKLAPNTKVVAKPAATTAVTKASVITLKKDGSPDKRFKSNQKIAKSSLKKDGTPDMRFKANKKHS